MYILTVSWIYNDAWSCETRHSQFLLKYLKSAFTRVDILIYMIAIIGRIRHDATQFLTRSCVRVAFIIIRSIHVTDDVTPWPNLPFAQKVQYYRNDNTGDVLNSNTTSVGPKLCHAGINYHGGTLFSRRVWRMFRTSRYLRKLYNRARLSRETRFYKMDINIRKREQRLTTFR